MRLIECYIENFGKLSDYSISFSDGLNTICESNGYGKTTLTVFIKSMLYGLEDTRKHKLEENDRKHYLPWNSGRCGGSLTFEANGKAYRIERSFGQKASDDTFKLYDNLTGKESSDFGENLGEQLFEIDADGFLRTIFLSEANLSGKNENKTVSAKLSDLSGAIGDMSVMDDAIELLEKKRKMYYKQGGRGELASLKERIRELNTEIEAIEALDSSLKAKEAELAAINTKLSSLYENKKAYDKEEGLRIQRKIRQSLELEYKKMHEQLDSEKIRFSEISRFFASGHTTLEEIAEMRDADAERKRLVQLVSAEVTPTEYTKLAENFSPDEIEAVISEADRTVKELSEQQSIQKMTEEYRADAIEKNKRVFDGIAPQISEVDEFIRLLDLNAGKSKKTKFLIPIGLAIICISTALGFTNPIFFVGSIIGVVAAIFGLTFHSSAASSKSKETRIKAAAFIRSCTGNTVADRDLVPSLYELRSIIDRYWENVREIERYDSQIAEAQKKISALTDKAYQIIKNFPLPPYSDVTEGVELLKRKYSTYRFHVERENERSQGKEEAAKKVKALEEKLSEYLSKFPTNTQSPLDEISAMLMSYLTTKEALQRLERELLDFAKRNDITSISNAETDDSEPIINTVELEQRLTELEQERALAERSIREIKARMDECDYLLDERDSLTAKSERYAKELDVIRKTQKYLADAKDLLTAKYLKKTKDSFDGYIAMLTGEQSESFRLGTSFEVKKNEHGTLRDADAYSKGTRELYALITRLALVDSLYEKERPFLILDDPFAHFDDKRLSSAMTMLKKLSKTKQIVYLTCTKNRT